MTVTDDLHVFGSSEKERLFVEISRPIYSEHDFLSQFHSTDTKDIDTFHKKISKKLVNAKTRISCKNFLKWVLSALPVLTWLPQYKLKRDGIRDLVAGLTLGVILIPQGMAYSMVAALPPIVGLYMSLGPVLVYALLGTSRHLSIGSFAIISLMVGEIIEERVGPKVAAFQPTNTTSRSEYVLDLKMRYAVASSMVVGLAQVLMGLVRIGFVTIFLSDPLINGFTTGATLHILTSQVRHYFGIDIPLPERIGFFALFKTYYYLFANIRYTNVASLLIGFVSTVLLFLAKYLNDKYGKYVRGIPLPWELILVAIVTGMSYGFRFHETFNVNVIGEVPKGLPPISIPRLSDMQEIAVNASVIAIVIFAINISLAKGFAKKNGYTINVNQELYAYGLANIISSFLSCFPSAASLSRSLIQENLGSTQAMANSRRTIEKYLFQIASLWSAFVIILVLVVLAPLFTALPNAILAAIILVALKGALKQFGGLPALWKLSKTDFFIWISSFLAVVCFGVAYGLGIALSINIITTLVRSSWPSSSVLGHVNMTGVFKSKKTYAAQDIPGVRIFQYHGPLFYANVEHFQEAVYTKTVDPRKCAVVELACSRNFHEDKDDCKRMAFVKSENDAEIERIGTDQQVAAYYGLGRLRPVDSSPSYPADDRVDFLYPPVDLLYPPVAAVDPRYTKVMHSLIIDCSQVSYIDSMAIATLTAVVSEYKKKGVAVYFACCSERMQQMLYLGGFTEKFGNDSLYLTVQDAVLVAISFQKTHGISPPLSEDAEEAELNRSQVYNRTCSTDTDVPLIPTRSMDTEDDDVALLDLQNGDIVSKSEPNGVVVS